MRKGILLFAIVSTTILSCKKEEKTEETEKTNKELIVGKWTSTQVTAFTYDKTNQDTIIYLDFPGPFFTFDFKSDGTFSNIQMGDTTAGTYSVQGSILTVIEDGETTEAEIKTLTSSKLILESDEHYTESGVEYQDYSYVEFFR